MNKRTPRKLICVALALVLTLSLLPMSAFAAGEVAIDETNFPDANFRQYVLDYCDADGNYALSAEEIANITEIHASGDALSPPDYIPNPPISSLKGIEHFTALTFLDCSGNLLTSLDVSKNTALIELNCGNNQLTTLNVSKNIALTRLVCYDNEFSALDIQKNTALETLNCSGNPLFTLDVTRNTSLTDLFCTNNNLATLDVSHNTELRDLDCSSNQLSSLNLSENHALEMLGCSDNQLKDLDLSQNSELFSLDCGGNHISTLDFSNNRKLISLGCSENNLSSLNIRNCEILESLYCGGNPLTSLDVSHNSKLLDLSVGNCNLATLDTSHNPQLDALRIDGNPLTSIDVSQNSVLRFLYAAGCQLTKLDLGMHYFLELLDIRENQLTSLDLSHNPYLVVFSGQANSYTVNKHKGFDYTTLPGKFDVTKVSNVKGGKFDTAKHTFSFDDGVTEATYDYATGNSKAPTASFKLVYSGSDVPVTPSKNPFTDVPADQYYYEPVQWAVKNGITSGVSKDKFGPNNPCTRGQIVTFLWAAAGRPEPTSTTNPFRDVSSKDYFYKAVLWAVENKITAGVAPDRFAPHQTCTRAQTVTFLWASQGRPASSTKVQFTDVSAKDYFADSVAWAYENGVTSGVGGGRFGSYNTCTRGQIVTFLYKTFN